MFYTLTVLLCLIATGCQNVRDINPDLVVHESQLFCARL